MKQVILPKGNIVFCGWPLSSKVRSLDRRPENGFWLREERNRKQSQAEEA
jgi:hypothetical protein